MTQVSHQIRETFNHLVVETERGPSKKEPPVACGFILLMAQKPNYGSQKKETDGFI